MKQFNNRTIHKNQNGFTLIELLVFMTVLATLLLVMSQAFSTIMDVQRESKSYSSIDLDGRFILARLAYDFQRANTGDSARNYIDTPAPGSTSAMLRVRIDSLLHTYIASDSGKLLMTTPELLSLSSSESSISGLLFQRIGPGTNRDTIKINFRLTSKTERRAGFESRDFQTVLGFP